MNRMMTKPPLRSSRGFTMIELVIAVIIIAILVGIAVPIVQQRARQAKLSSAKADLEHLANAEERVAIDTGYLVRLFMLDDVPGASGDGFSNERSRATPQKVNYSTLFIDPKTGNYVNPTTAGSVFMNLSSTESDYSGLATRWNGPYMNWTRDTEVDSSGNPIPDDIPNDPWGNDYILLTQAGMVNDFPTLDGNPTEGTITLTPSIKGVSPGMPTGLDRPMVLSLGEDGLPGDNGQPKGSSSPLFGEGDDLSRKF